MVLHKGEIIEKAVREKQFSITLLSKKLKKSRKYVYNLFEKNDVSLDIMLQIGKIIHYDFSQDLKSINKIPKEYQIEVVTNSLLEYDDIKYWKSKYFELLEQHKNLLEKRLSDYFLEKEIKK